MSFESMLTTTLEVWRDTFVTDATMGTERRAAYSSTILGRIQPRKSVQRDVAGAVAVVVTLRLYAAIGADIQEADEIRNTATGKTYWVEGVHDIQGHHLEVDLVEHRPQR